MSPLLEIYTESPEHGGVSVFVIFGIPKYQGLDWWGKGSTV